MNVDKDIYNIVSDYFRGCISERDGSYLQNWLEQSTENKQLFTELEKVWEMTGELKTQLKPDVDAEWERFEELKKPEKRKNSSRIGKQQRFSSYFRIAAVLIPAFIVLSVVLYYLNDKARSLLVVTTSNGKKELLLADGTKVWLNRNTIFSYPGKFAENERIVKLKGEAYFEVAKEKLPFIIKTENTQIVVVGTAFNVRAVDYEHYTEVVVTRGIVQFKINSSNESTKLEAGEKGTYNKKSHLIKKVKVLDNNAIGWKNEQLSFKDTPLKEVEVELSRYFNIGISVDKVMEKCKFTGDFKHPQLEETLNIITLSLGATYKIERDSVYITGAGCAN